MRSTPVLWVIMTLLATSWASAQEVDEAVVTARELAKEAIVELREGNATVAEEKLRRAYELVRAPSIAYLLGQALEKQGKLVEASELYLQATRLDVDKGEAAGQQQAKERAAKAREALLPRIPRLVVSVDGVEVARVSVEVNGRLLPSALVGAERLVDPGEVRIQGRVGDTAVEQNVAIAEGEEKSVVLRFEGVGPAPATAEAGAKPSRTTDPAQEQGSGAPLRLLGWTGVGLGVVGVAGGAVFLGIAAGKRSDRDAVADECSPGTPLRCTPDQTAEIRGLEDDQASAKTISVVSFAAGGAFAAAGVTLLVLSGREDKQARSVEPWVGLGTAGIRGTF